MMQITRDSKLSKQSGNAQSKPAAEQNPSKDALEVCYLESPEGKWMKEFSPLLAVLVEVHCFIEKTKSSWKLCYPKGRGKKISVFG
ncbi:MAG: hypothetical protein N2049_09960 [Anaerolineales bacterium]|nr:hypothetical protein [Anaerolineales bacterium]